MKMNLRQIANALRIKGESSRKNRPTKGAFGHQKKMTKTLKPIKEVA